MDTLMTTNVRWERTFYLVNVMLAFMSIIIIVKDAIAIKNGKLVKGEKGFMVYLLKSKVEKQESNYSDWMCGGAIIHPRFILTSAACLYDVDHIYVISGYKKYVNADDIDNDECTKRMKKRIVYYCITKTFAREIEKFKTEYSFWNKGDIGIAQVDKPFDYYDSNYTKYCSYLPTPIRVSFGKDYLKRVAFTIALTYGWGHRHYYRPEGVHIDLNEDYLRYSSFALVSQKYCHDSFLEKKFIDHSKRHFVCAFFEANMDENGHIYEDIKLNNSTRREEITNKDISRSLGGFCQNDHGGPLTTFIGGKEVVIGVSSMFFVSKNMECIGPFFYTKTHCIGKLMFCFIYPHQYRRSLNCHNLRRKMVERNVTWLDQLEKEPIDIPTDVE